MGWIFLTGEVPQLTWSKWVGKPDCDIVTITDTSFHNVSDKYIHYHTDFVYELPTAWRPPSPCSLYWSSSGLPCGEISHYIGSLSFWGLPKKQTNKQKWKKTAPGNCCFPLPLLLKSLPPLLSLTNPQRTFAFLDIRRLSTIFTFSFNSKDSNCALNIGNCLGTPISVPWRTLLFFPDRWDLL